MQPNLRCFFRGASSSEAAALRSRRFFLLRLCLRFFSLRCAASPSLPLRWTTDENCCFNLALATGVTCAFANRQCGQPNYSRYQPILNEMRFNEMYALSQGWHRCFGVPYMRGNGKTCVSFGGESETRGQ